MDLSVDENASGDSGLGSKYPRLDTPPRIRRFLAGLIRRWHAGDLPSEDVTRIAHSLKILLAMLEGSTVEQRLQALESRVAEMAGS